MALYPVVRLGKARQRELPQGGSQPRSDRVRHAQQALVVAQEAGREPRNPCSRARRMAARSLENTSSDKSGSGSSQEGARSAERKPRRGRGPCPARRACARRGGRRGRSSSPGGGGRRCRVGRRQRAPGGAWSRGPGWPSGGTGARRCRACRSAPGARARAGARGRVGVGGEPEDGVEARARVADGAAGGAALADGRRVRVLRGCERGVALPLRFGLGGAEEEG